MPDMLDTHMLDMDMVILDTMASVMLMLSPRLMLIPTFCMEDMAMDTILDMPGIEDMLDTHTVDMPTTDKLKTPRQDATCIRKLTEQTSMSSSSVTNISVPEHSYCVQKQEKMRIKIYHLMILN